VAVPTAITADVLMPATMVGIASGISTRRRRAALGSPSARADTRSDSGMPTRPACVLRTMGSRP